MPKRYSQFRSATLLKKTFFIFIFAFLLNLVWENLHSVLYLHYQNGPIGEWVLFRAALFDAGFIALLGLIFLSFSFLCKREWLALPIGFLAAVLLEIYALKTGRWTYNEMMPIIPIIKTGLTPTIQLGLLSFIAFKTVKLNSRS